MPVLITVVSALYLRLSRTRESTRGIRLQNLQNCEHSSDPSWDSGTYLPAHSLVTSSVIAQPNTLQATRAAKNLGKAIFVEPVEVRTITWKTASLLSKVGPKDPAGSQRRRSLVRPHPLGPSFAFAHSRVKLTSAGSASRILRLRELCLAKSRCVC